MNSMPVISLFSGAGGMDRGFENAGFRVLLALDDDPAAVSTYNWNRTRQHAPAIRKDLSKANAKNIIRWWEERAGTNTRPIGLLGGPPCQAFSIANVHKLTDDPRAKLPLHYARILKAVSAKFDLDFFVFENVAGLAQRLHTASMETLVRRFEDSGFGVRWFFLDAVDFRVAQYRRRLFFVGFNRSRFDATSFAPPVGGPDRVTVREAIGGLPDAIFYSRFVRPLDLGLHPNHWCMTPRSDKFTNGALKSGEMKGRSFRMLRWDTPSWTVSYGHREVHVHPNGKRRLSVYEAMLLQGFPPDYELLGTLSQQIRLVSDAVPPPLAHALAVSIRKFLAQARRSTNPEAQLDVNGQSEQLGLRGVQTVAPRSTRA